MLLLKKLFADLNKICNACLWVTCHLNMLACAYIANISSRAHKDSRVHLHVYIIDWVVQIVIVQNDCLHFQ